MLHIIAPLLTKMKIEPASQRYWNSLKKSCWKKPLTFICFCKQNTWCINLCYGCNDILILNRQGFIHQASFNGPGIDICHLLFFFFTKNVAIMLGLEALKDQSPRLHNKEVRIPQVYFDCHIEWKSSLFPFINQV